MVLALKTKITQEVQQEVADGVEAEKKGHSIVITGLAELGASKSLMERKRDLEEKVANVLDALEVDCRPEVAYSRVNYSELRKFLARVDWLEVFDNYQSVAEMYRRFCPVMYDSLAKDVEQVPPLTSDHNKHGIDMCF
ncbi:hypothetical protein RB195_011006 [Necator americanus]|uniref:Uncharacterized protein n=1 Tax=Necator americanus TaxID=51031 RepID=A0ABR1D0H0_NECAM